MASADTVYSTSALVTFATDGSYTLTMDKFDSSLGVLTGATLYFYGAEDVSNLTLVNNSGSTQTFNLALQSNLAFNSGNTANNADKYTGQNLDIFDTGVGPGTAQYPLSAGPITLGPSGSGICPEYNPSSSCNSISYTPPSLTVQNIDPVYGLSVGTGLNGVTGVIKNIVGTDLLNYVQAGPSTSFDLTGSTHSFFSGDGGGNNIDQHVTTTARFQAEIDYSYRIPPPPPSTPEPATLVLMGTALAGVGLLRKRIKS
ncbi:MAG TPA: choice-of-anchor E domain-containing protein [Bryobacteraceae bacterium]|jgi:hypothetical protein